MFDQLIEESPMIQKIREQSEILTLQRTLVNVVRARYPDLAEFAQRQVGRFNKLDALELLIEQVVTAPDVSTVRWLLESGT
jgi:hypothetical protein